MHYAASKGHSEIVQLLLTAGATDFPNQVGMSVINPRRACAARVTVIVLSVCLSVCMSMTILAL